MAKLSSELSMRDGFSRTLDRLLSGIDNVINAMDTANSNAESVDFDMPRINSSARQTAQAVENVGSEVNDLNNRNLNNLNSSFGSLGRTIIVVNQGLELIKKAAQFLNGKIAIADEMISIYARLDLINDGLQTTSELQKLIYDSAQRARGSYSSTAQVVSKLGILAKDAFSSNREIIAFAEQMNKQFIIGGSSIQEQTSAMYQLTQAMAAGRLQGDEFRSILENAPLLAQSIADRMGLTTGALKEMSSQGAITAQIIKDAMFSSAEETNRKFAELPVTFGQMTQSLKNQMLMAFDPLIQQFSQFINSEQGKQFFADLASAAIVFANACLGVFKVAEGIYKIFTKYWSVIKPIVIGLAVIMGLYTGALIINSIITGINTAVQTAQAIALALKTGSTIADVAATNELTVAQWALNSAFLACPITWIIALVIALIAIFYAVIAVINKVAGTSLSATGIIMGAFATAGAFLWDLFLGVFDLVLGVINGLVNPFIKIANFIGNVFSNPISSVIYLFQGMADGVLATLEKIASAMDFVFGSHMADTVADWRAGLKDLADDAVKKYAPNEDYKKIINELDLGTDKLGLKRIEYNDAWNAGYSIGDGLGDKVSNFDPSKFLDSNNKDNLLGSDVNDVYVTGGGLDKEVDISNQSLKYLSDIAEEQALHQFDALNSFMYIVYDDTESKLSSGDKDLLVSAAGAKTNVYYLQYQGGVNMQTEVKNGEDWETIKQKAKAETQAEIEIGLSDLDKVVCR